MSFNVIILFACLVVLSHQQTDVPNDKRNRVRGNPMGHTGGTITSILASIDDTILTV